MAESPEELVGKVLAGSYRIERRLGAGGMGEVYEASHLRLRRRFAVKMLYANIASNSEAAARVQRFL